jgi:hypothetical protein
VNDRFHVRSESSSEAGSPIRWQVRMGNVRDDQPFGGQDRCQSRSDETLPRSDEGHSIKDEDNQEKLEAMKPAWEK